MSDPEGRSGTTSSSHQFAFVFDSTFSAPSFGQGAGSPIEISYGLSGFLIDHGPVGDDWIEGARAGLSLTSRPHLPDQLKRFGVETACGRLTFRRTPFEDEVAYRQTEPDVLVDLRFSSAELQVALGLLREIAGSGLRTALTLTAVGPAWPLKDKAPYLSIEYLDRTNAIDAAVVSYRFSPAARAKR